MEAPSIFLLAVIAVTLLSVETGASTARTVVRMTAMSKATRRRLPELQGYTLSFQPYERAFEKFKQKYDVYYTSDVEEQYRFSIFKHNVQLVEAHNYQYHHGNQTYFMGVNQFSDKTHEEFQAYNRLGRYALKSSYKRLREIECKNFHPKQDFFPKHLDWTQKGAVTSVKNQGQCGSCWTFSATGAVEGSFAILSGRLLSFSEQQIVDCCRREGCDGCGGGDPDQAFVYINQTGGLETEREYKYTALRGNCKFESSEVKVRVTGCAVVPENDEDALKAAIALHGPVSVAIDASNESFQKYGGGVYYEEDCSSSNLDHGVLAVGYGSEDGEDYWLVKNSWSKYWGVDGYIKMARNRDNNCGIASYASFPYTARP